MMQAVKRRTFAAKCSEGCVVDAPLLPASNDGALAFLASFLLIKNLTNASKSEVQSAWNRRRIDNESLYKFWGG